MSNSATKWWRNRRSSTNGLPNGIRGWRSYQKKFERSSNPNDQQIALHISGIRGNQVNLVDKLGKRLVALLSASRFDSAGDLKNCMLFSDDLADSLRTAREKLCENFGPQAQRKAHESLLKSLKAVSAEQGDLQSLNLSQKKFAEEQQRIRTKTEFWAKQVRGEGKGNGMVGKHLEDAAALIQEVIEIQKSAEKLAADGDAAAAMLKQSETLAKLSRVEDHASSVLQIARLLEQRVAMRDLERCLENAVAELGRIEKRAKNLVEKISRNADKKPTRDSKIEWLRLSDEVAKVFSSLSKSADKNDDGNNAIKSGLYLAGTELKLLQRRLEGLDFGDETTFRQLKKTTDNLDRGKKAVQAARVFLGAFETGELREPILNDVHEIAQELKKIGAGQERLSERLFELWVDEVGRRRWRIEFEKK